MRLAEFGTDRAKPRIIPHFSLDFCWPICYQAPLWCSLQGDPVFGNHARTADAKACGVAMADIPDDLLDRAARGKADAQAELVDVAIASTECGVRPIEALTAAELWARMAASHGGLDDMRRLASVLMMRAGYERMHGSVDLAASLDAEALTLLDIGTDHGDELAGRVLAEVSSVLPAAPFDLLRRVKAEQP